MSVNTTIVSKKLRQYFKLMFKCGNICHTHPFQWNEGLQRGELVISKKQRVVWYLNVGITAVYFIYLIGREIQVTLDEESSNILKVYIQFVLFFYAFPVLFQTGIWVKMKELPSFYGLNLTAIQVFEEYISKQFVEDHPEVVEQEKENDQQPPPPRCMLPKLVDLFFGFVWYGFLSAALIVGPLNLARPQSPEFISSFLAPDSGTLRWPLILFSALFQMYYGFTYVANGFLFIFLGFGFAIPGLVALVQFRGWLRIKSGKFPQKKVRRILSAYRSVQVIVKAFESCYCDIVIPGAKTILTCLCIFCAYGTIRMEGFLATFLVLIGILAAGILVPLLSAFAFADTVSREMLQLMREPVFQSSLTPYQKKEVKSLQPIQLRMRRSYIVDKECVKTVYQIIFESTVDLLVSNA